MAQPFATAVPNGAGVERVRAGGTQNIALLFDLYHLAANGDDIARTIDAYAGVTAHVQIADFPGRGQPGTGQLDSRRHLTALAGRGYDGRIGLEYKPTGTTADSFGWMSGWRT